MNYVILSKKSLEIIANDKQLREYLPMWIKESGLKFKKSGYSFIIESTDDELQAFCDNYNLHPTEISK